MVSVQRRFLKGEPVGREEMRDRPVASERIDEIVRHVRRRARQ